MNRRLIRLYNDYKEVKELIGNHPSIEIKDVMGDPPERYLINYKIKGLIQSGEEIIEKDSHLCEIILSGDYPRHEPICRIISMVVFHPNIAPNKICIADHWAAGESLTDIIIRIGEMICYQNYNIKSPLNGEAAKWAEENIRRFPIDDVNLEPIRNSIEPASEIQPIENIAYMPPQLEVIEINQDQSCTNCGAGSKTVPIRTCSNGHVVCQDCMIDCANCGKKLCVLCSLIKCSTCGKIVCQECQNRCLECNSLICNDDTHKCSICGSILCNRCISHCSDCHLELCYVHKNDHQKIHGTAQLPDHQGAKIESEEIIFKDLSPEPNKDGMSREPKSRKCPVCGNSVIEPDAAFCVMCGNRVK